MNTGSSAGGYAAGSEWRWLAALLALAATACATGPVVDGSTLRDEVATTERAFARTMAERDFESFAGFLAEETVFFSGGEALRGKDAVLAGWRRFFDGAQAPFSWEPRDVEVLDSGTLALSTGPVHDASGNEIAVFTSIWRREAPGTWRIVFDRGGCPCEPRQ